jgi:hypothetical protein
VAKTHYTNDFGDPRWQGSHEGNDIMARKKSKVVAVEAGRVQKWTKSANAGCMLYLYGRSGTTYMYVHLNNDRTMRNDTRGNSTCRNGIAYAPGLRSGQRVTPGQLIGYVGDSGDANGIAAHLHFEVHPRKRAVSPYRHLRRGRHLLYPRPPASVETLWVKIRGRVVAKRLDVEPNLLRVRVGRVRLSNGWSVRPARNVTLKVPSEAGALEWGRRDDGGRGHGRRAGHRLDDAGSGDVPLRVRAARPPHGDAGPSSRRLVPCGQRGPELARRALRVRRAHDRAHDRDPPGAGTDHVGYVRPVDAPDGEPG